MNDKQVPWTVRLTAARDLLDRAGLGAKAALEVTVAPWQQAITIGGIIAEVPDDFDPAADFEPEIVDAEIVADPPAAPAAPRPTSRTVTTVPAVPTADAGTLLPPARLRDRLGGAGSSR